MIAMLERFVVEVEELAETALRAEAERDPGADRDRLTQFAEAARSRLNGAQSRLQSVEGDSRQLSSHNP